MLGVRQDKLSTIYWLPKPHKKNHNKQGLSLIQASVYQYWTLQVINFLPRFIKTHVIRYSEKKYERADRNLIWSVKNSDEVLNKLKSREFYSSRLSTWSFYVLYTTVPYNLIKKKLTDLRALFKGKARFLLL